MTDPIRCFFAVAPSEEVLRTLEDFLAPWRRRLGNLKWVRRDQIHLTLKFCGSQPPQTVDALGENLEGLAASLAPFPLSLGRTGRFPPSGTPRVLWAGLEGERSALGRLFDTVETGSVAAGLEPERRPPAPHLTLARLREGQSLSSEDLDLFLASSPPPVSWTVGELLLLRSYLGPQGPRYSLLGRFPLARIP